MIFEMRLEPIPFEATKAKRKLIEVRLCDDRRSQIMVGDKIAFKNTTTEELLKVEVIGIRKYTSIEKLVRDESFDMTGGIYTDLDHWVQSIYRYYSNEDQAKYGLLAIEIKI